MGPRDVLVIDAGPLLDSLVLRCESGPYRVRWRHPPQLHGLRNNAEADLFLSLLLRHRGRVWTSSGVLSELASHVRTGEDHALRGEKRTFRQRAWNALRAMWMECEIEERLVSFSNLDEDRVVDLGLVDTGLLHLAREARTERERGVLVTNDGTLLSHCLADEVHAEYARDLVRIDLI
ncbi:MAG: hypothetical protein WKG00_01600 [Polyangiaceae bacterium]